MFHVTNCPQNERVRTMIDAIIAIVVFAAVCLVLYGSWRWASGMAGALDDVSTWNIEREAKRQAKCDAYDALMETSPELEIDLNESDRTQQVWSVPSPESEAK